MKYIKNFPTLLITCLTISLIGCSKRLHNNDFSCHNNLNNQPIDLIHIKSQSNENDDLFILYDDCTNSNNIQAQYNTHNHMWGHKGAESNIKYYIENKTEDIPENKIKEAFKEAFELWAAVTPLTFSEVTTKSKTNIIIRFFSNKSYKKNSVAYVNPYKNPMEIYFNDDKIWTLSKETPSKESIKKSPIDLITIATHEIGHVLGLAHSFEENAIMHTTYKGRVRSLHPDDIKGIQSIYGKYLEKFISINNQTINNTKSYRASRKISATNLTVTKTANVKLAAKKEINLNSNFTVNRGASFDATIN